MWPVFMVMKEHVTNSVAQCVFLKVMKLYGTEEEDISGSDTHIMIVSRNTLLVLVFFMASIDNKRHKLSAD